MKQKNNWRLSRRDFLKAIPYTIAAGTLAACTEAGILEKKGKNTLEPTIIIDGNILHQTLDGFGATTMTLAHTYEALPQDTLGELRSTVIQKVYQEVGLNTGNIDLTVHEKSSTAVEPSQIIGLELDVKRVESVKTLLLDLAEPYGFTDYYFGKINTRWGSTWLHDLMREDYERFLDTCAEYLTAIMVYWRDQHGIVPRLLMPFNEPLSGNRELADGNAKDIANILKCAGARLRQEGFDQVKFIVPNDETEEKTLQSISVILNDGEARQYVGAIGYHPYPYGSIYASVPNILKTSGIGKPDNDRLKIRATLADFARKTNLPLWMTEVSHPEVDPRSFDHLRGLAIHIHDELVYANASAYFAMNNMWDLTTHRDHFKNDDIYSEADTVVLANNETKEVMITGMGYAIGHYARWMNPGSIRVEATCDDPLLLVTAFVDQGQSRLSMVVINNADKVKKVQFNIQNLKLIKFLTGERSTGTDPFPASYWQSLTSWQPKNMQNFAVDFPGLSVTSLGVDIQ